MFPCSKCGECCRHISKVLPDYDRGDGVCINLNKDNLCDIYESRPFICNVDEVYNRYFRGRMTIEEFYKWTDKACKVMQRVEG